MMYVCMNACMYVCMYVCVYVYQVIERQWEPLCVVKVFDRAPYPKFGRFPGGMDLAVGFRHLHTHAHAHTY